MATRTLRSGRSGGLISPTTDNYGLEIGEKFPLAIFCVNRNSQCLCGFSEAERNVAGYFRSNDERKATREIFRADPNFGAGY